MILGLFYERWVGVCKVFENFCLGLVIVNEFGPLAFCQRFMCSYYVCPCKTIVKCCARTVASVAGVENQKRRVFDWKVISHIPRLADSIFSLRSALGFHVRRRSFAHSHDRTMTYYNPNLIDLYSTHTYNNTESDVSKVRQ